MLRVLAVLLGEDLAAQVQNRKRAGNTNSSASSKDGKVPATDKTQPAKATTNLQQHTHMLKLSSSGNVRNSKVGGGDEREHHHQAEEGGNEEGVDAESGDEEGERDEHHGDVVEALGSVPFSSGVAADF